MTQWDTGNCGANIRTILDGAPSTEVGRMWLTAYQIAIAFAARFPADFAAMGLPIGGQGTGPNSLSQYLAGQLAERILRYGSITDIEISYFDLSNVNSIRLDANGTEITAAATSNRAVSLFRLREC